MSELDRFKSECEVLFNGPLDESPPNRQVGLVVNWLGSEAGLILHSLNLTHDEPDTIFHALRDVFRPIENRMMSRFKFKSLKQKQGATVDAYMAELKVSIKECSYEQNMQNILLKDQFIFGVTVHEIQDHLLNDIEDDHDLNHCLQEARKIVHEIQDHLLNDIEDHHELNHCLQEARKIESHLAQCKLLGLKSVQFDSIGQCDGGRKKISKSKGKRSQSRSQSGIRDCKYCCSNHPHKQCPAYGKNCKACGKKNHFAKKCWSAKDQSSGGAKHKSFKYR